MINLVIAESDMEVWKVMIGLCHASANKETCIVAIEVALPARLNDSLEFLEIISRHQNEGCTCIDDGLISVKVESIIAKLCLFDADSPEMSVFQGAPTDLRFRLSMLFQVIPTKLDSGSFVFPSETERKKSFGDQPAFNQSI